MQKKNGVSLEELCVYALGSDEQQAELESSAVEEDAAGLGNNSQVNEDEENYDAEASDSEYSEDDEEQERHDIDDHHEHGLTESVEDMASEGGHIEEDRPIDISSDDSDSEEENTEEDIIEEK